MACRIRDTYSVFVGQLAFDVTKDDLKEIFKGCGQIADIVVMKDSNDIKKPYGFVRFLESESAFKAVSEMNGWILKGSTMLVDISKDTLQKIKLENGVATKRQQVKPNPVPKSCDLAKDTMYVHRLKDTLASASLHYSHDQMNLKRLLTDIGPNSVRLTSRCSTRWSALKESVSFERVSAKLMEKCSGDDESEKFHRDRVEEFKKSLHTIMSEIRHVIDVDKLTVGADREITREANPETDKVIFNQLVVPESVRLIQRLEKYSGNVDDNYVQCSQQKCKVESETVKHFSEEMPELEEIQSSGDIHISENSQNPSSEIKHGSLEYSLNTLNALQLGRQRTDWVSGGSPTETFQVDPLEALYLKMSSNKGSHSGTVQRSSSRDSSMSEDSVEGGGNIDDSGIECDGRATQPLLATPEMQAEGRARALDHRNPRNRGAGGVPLDLPKQEFSLENYILKGIGRGRGLSSYGAQLTSTPGDPAIPAQSKGRGILSNFTGPS